MCVLVFLPSKKRFYGSVRPKGRDKQPFPDPVYLSLCCRSTALTAVITSLEVFGFSGFQLLLHCDSDRALRRS